MERRDFIKMLGLAGTSASAYAACSSYMREALAQSTTIDDLLNTAAHCQGGSLDDVEHVIFLMQENRSFDHYYGTLRGVRGFGDPRPLRLKNGDSVFNQPRAPLLSSLSYWLNSTNWMSYTKNWPKDIKPFLKTEILPMFPTVAPTVTPLINKIPQEFIERVLRSDWDSLLPPEMAGKTIPELLEELKAGMLAVKSEDIDENFAELVKGVVLSLLDNAIVKDIAAATMPGGAFDPATIKPFLSAVDARSIVGMLLPMIASLIDIATLKKSWPAAVAVLPSLEKGLPNLAELFYWLQGLSTQFAASPFVGTLPQDAQSLPPEIAKFIPKDIKARYPKLVASLQGKGHIKPFQVQRGTDSAGEYKSFGLAHTYDDQRDAINHGWNDQWMLAKGEDTMAHFDVAKDLSFYNKLINAFTICDNYHCSTHTGTDPNRAHFWTGTAAGKTNNSFFTGGVGPRPDWKTYPERLQELGVDWKIYQNMLSSDGFFNNGDDTTLRAFKKYMDPETDLFKGALSANTVLREQPDVVSVFERDVAAGTLPPISWISAPDAFCEHPGGISPHFGEYYVNEILKVLAAHPEVWKKTVFIINYDENDGFFDHVPPPLPPLPAAKDAGKVSDGIVISTSSDENDFNTEHAWVLTQDFATTKYVRHPALPKDQLTMGLGCRVPCLIISPWTVGGRVCSELFDHTSTLRFLDTWLAARKKHNEGTIFPNISSWRKAICGDMTSAFDFTRKLDTVASEGKTKIDAAIAAAKSVPAYRTKADQAALMKALPTYKGKGTDIAADLAKETRLKQDRTQVELLPLGYDFNVFGSVVEKAGKPDKLQLSFRNRGTIGVALNVYSYVKADEDRGAWFYALTKAGKDGKPVEVVDAYDLIARGGKYEFAVHAPNGYLSEFRGDTNRTEQRLPEVIDIHSTDGGKTVEFVFDKWPTANVGIKAVSAYTGQITYLSSGAIKLALPTENGWYDVSFIDSDNAIVASAETTTGYLRRYAGHLENGKLSKTDPAIGIPYDVTKRIYDWAGA
ncbi:alkaline phosphatase family protein [Candidatus Phyllobacterium onerii]|uniref:alkaline phosphatase family protein n=1 Tax=Candidatus Phyllobacterium onerii TaxID=3020828 RepID=UPI00232F8569|nr:alkaline phosphatase family protein [Phyllobacterium sp. IY22]